jgi:hypothetical protein
MTSKMMIQVSRQQLEYWMVMLRNGLPETVSSMIQTVLEAPEAPRQDNSSLMKIAADLANRAPLRQLYLVCDTQSRIGVQSLHEYLDKCGDLLAGTALDIRRAITSQAAPLSPDHSGGVTGKVARDAERYHWMQNWFIDGGFRSELNPNAHMCLTTKAMMDAAIDAYLDKAKELNQ